MSTANARQTASRQAPARLGAQHSTSWIGLFYTIVAFELFVGGGGRLTEVGPFSLRMLLFAAMLLIILGMAFTRPQRQDQFLTGCAWVLFYLCINLLVFLSGLLHGHSQVDVFADIQQSLFWLAAPFFAVAMSDIRLVRRTEHLVMTAAVVMSVAYLVTIFLVLQGRVHPFDLWAWMEPSGEFFFRNELLFFYKGNLYLGIAIVFLAAGKVERPWLLMLIFITLLLTLTRGFVLAAFVALLAMFSIQGRWKAVFRIVFGTLLALVVIQFIVDLRGETLIGNRDSSDGLRFADFRFMLHNMTPWTVLIGEGFGSAINGRINIETSYAWMLWKGGIPLLLFWMAPLLACLFSFLRIPPSSSQYRLACSFFFSVVFIYVQTATNPFLNNPIGLSFVIISIFSLRTLEKAASREAGCKSPSPLQGNPSSRLG